MSEKVLVVDDEDAVRRTLRRRLEQEGFEVFEAACGRPVVATVKTHGVALVVTDILMPDMEGLETIRALRRECPAVPIIAISATPHLEYLSAARQFGAVKTFEKPFDLDDLVAAVRQAIETTVAVS
jgi:DNA-binding NtrC family response regulator